MLAQTGGAGLPSAGPNFSGMGASGASIGALGLSAYSSIMKGQGTQAADNAAADRADRAAQFGELQAGLTDTVMRENLNTTLSNIAVTRAAMHTDITSPTGVAVAAHNTMLSDRQRTAALLTIDSQVAQDKADANYDRQAGRYALDQGYIGAGIGVAGGVAKALVAA